MINMSSISMLESKLPPGFRFHPRDEELVCDYLMRKVTHSDSPLMVDVDLNKCEPWDIPETACVGGKEWYFYTERDRKYATGLRTNRATACGYWKATGKDRPILRKGKLLVGMRKTLVFYQGRAPKGRKTQWVMHEFRLEGEAPHLLNSSTKEDWVLCRVFYKSKEAAAAAAGADKPSMGSCYDDTGSSNLPPLMDSYISFDHTRTHIDIDIDIDNYDEQVPCFSIFSDQNQTSPAFSHISNNVEPTDLLLLPTKQARSTVLAMGGSSSYSHPNINISCDSKAIEAVLNQLTKMESNSKESPSLGEGSSESYLTEVGMPNLWNNFSS